MRKADFSLGYATDFDRDAYRDAQERLKRHESLFDAHRGVITGYWVGWREGVAHIMVTVESGKTANADSLIPDNIEGLNIYYLESETRLASVV